MTHKPVEEWARGIYWYFTHRHTKRYSAPLLIGKMHIKTIKAYNFFIIRLEKVKRFVNIKYWPESREIAIIVFDDTGLMEYILTILLKF